jgi:hypothetical protein
VVATGTSADALRALRRTRRRNRLSDVHWIDALYRAYLAGLGAVLLVLFASSQLPDDPLTVEAAADFAVWAPPWLGLAFAFAVGTGMRSGGRGGPLVLEAPVVAHELQAPVDRRAVLLGPALKQLRFLVFAGAVLGAVTGEVAARRLPVTMAAAIASAMLAVALAAALAAGCAMAVSGRRWGWTVANVLAGLVVAWSALDILAGVTTSPLTLLAQVAFWPIEFRSLSLVGIGVAVVVPIIGVIAIPGLSIESALRRAGLVSQLRFAVTLQDVRTVVLLRRQLAQERPRARPWLRLGRGGRLPAVWRRDWQSYFRFPAVRLFRMVMLAAAAGLALGTVWRGLTPMIVVAALALYVAAFDAAEPIAQEVDHPTRWESYPTEPGRVLLQHLPATFVVMLVICSLAGAAALVLVPLEVVMGLMPVIVIPVAASTAMAGTIGTAQGAPNAAQLAGLGPDLLGLVLLARLVVPPALVVVALLPLLAAGSDPATLPLAQISNYSSYAIFGVVGAYFWLRLRKPKHL